MDSVWYLGDVCVCLYKDASRLTTENSFECEFPSQLIDFFPLFSIYLSHPPLQLMLPIPLRRIVAMDSVGYLCNISLFGYRCFSVSHEEVQSEWLFCSSIDTFLRLYDSVAILGFYFYPNKYPTLRATER